MKLIRYFSSACIILLLILQTLILSSAANASGTPDRVVDNAQILSESEEDTLRRLISEFSEKQKLDLVILTENNINENAESYADDYYDYNDYGFGDKHDGILALYVKNYRMGKGYFHISTTGKAISIYRDSDIEALLDAVEPYIKAKNYDRAFSAFINKADDIARSTKNTRLAIKITVSTAVALILSFAVTGYMKHKLNSARPNRYANAYAVKDSLVLTRERDIFLRNTITKVKIQQSSSSTRTHTSSSGRSHGGGGRSM